MTKREILLAMLDLAIQYNEKCDDHINYNRVWREDLTDEEIIEIIGIAF